MVLAFLFSFPSQTLKAGDYVGQVGSCMPTYRDDAGYKFRDGSATADKTSGQSDRCYYHGSHCCHWCLVKPQDTQPPTLALPWPPCKLKPPELVYLNASDLSLNQRTKGRVRFLPVRKPSLLERYILISTGWDLHLFA
ncbi:hypothetical protein F4775DRAFT_90347 [Biscogniauxia sp. FL1348]|nr:hypothetical protein F4775DRAFT_90347 [Biscogniauxia sp. FL1348]